MGRLVNNAPEVLKNQKWPAIRRRINAVVSQLQKQFGPSHPGLKLTTQKFAEALDQGQVDSLPVISRHCPRSTIGRLDYVYYALLEAVIRSYWRRQGNNLERLLPLLEEVVKIGLKDYVVLGSQRTGFYLFLPGKTDK